MESILILSGHLGILFPGDILHNTTYYTIRYYIKHNYPGRHPSTPEPISWLPRFSLFSLLGPLQIPHVDTCRRSTCIGPFMSCRVQENHSLENKILNTQNRIGHILDQVFWRINILNSVSVEIREVQRPNRKFLSSERNGISPFLPLAPELIIIIQTKVMHDVHCISTGLPASMHMARSVGRSAAAFPGPRTGPSCHCLHTYRAIISRKTHCDVHQICRICRI